MAIIRGAHMIHFESQDFNYDGKKKEFFAEISELSRGRKEVFCRVFDDAIDEGFAIISERTGAVKVFVVNKIEENEGDVIAWTLVPADELKQIACGQKPSCYVTLVND